MRRAFLFLSAMLMTSAAAQADVTYTYTGQFYDEVYGPYTQSERITGSFTIKAPLAANLFLQELSVSTFSFNDGIRHVSQESGTTVPDYVVSTDAFGNITNYDLLNYVYDGSGPDAGFGVIDAFYSVVPNRDGRGSTVRAGSFTDPVTLPGIAGSNRAGTLVESATVTPEPSSFALLSTGLLGVGTIVRRRLLRG